MNLSSPKIAILCSNLRRFESFAELIRKKDFECLLTQNPEEIFDGLTGNPNSIVFVSWNMEGLPIKTLADRIIQEYQSDVLVFAEKDDTRTAAELVSSGIEKKIQAPFKEKNFLMAIQKIVNDRKIAYEKRLRKEKHAQKLQAFQNVKQTSENEFEIRQSKDLSYSDLTSTIESQAQSNQPVGVHKGTPVKKSPLIHHKGSEKKISPHIPEGEEFKRTHTHIKGEEPNKTKSSTSLLSPENNKKESLLHSKNQSETPNSKHFQGEKAPAKPLKESNSNSGQKTHSETINWSFEEKKTHPSFSIQPALGEERTATSSSPSRETPFLESSEIFSPQSLLILFVGIGVGTLLCFYLLYSVLFV